MAQLSRPAGARKSLWEFTQDKRHGKGIHGKPGLLLGEIGKTIEDYNRKYSPIKQTVGQGWLTKYMPGGELDTYSDEDPFTEGHQRLQRGHQDYGVFGKKAWDAATDAGYSPAQIFQGLAGAWGGDGIQGVGPALGGIGGKMYESLKDWKTAGNWMLGYMGPDGGFGEHSYNQVRQDIPGYQTPKTIRDHLDQSGFRGAGRHQRAGMKNWVGPKVESALRNDPFLSYISTGSGSAADYDPNTHKAKVKPPVTTSTSASTGSTTQTTGTTATTGTASSAGAAGTSAGSPAVAAAPNVAASLPVIGAPLSVGSAYNALGIQGARPSSFGSGVVDFFGRKGQRKRSGVNPALQINPLNLGG